MLGGFLVIFARWIAWIHIPIAIWGAYVFLAGKTCPLTPLEKRFYKKAGLEVSEDDFVEGFMPFSPFNDVATPTVEHRTPLPWLLPRWYVLHP
ncbi:MAG: DUF2784 family protein [Desulfobacterales bacterium]|nr:DUF2784 family protein [Desulfobacterales bacterium]